MRLELAHAELLDALEKADGRFAGAPAPSVASRRPAAPSTRSSTSSASGPTPTT